MHIDIEDVVTLARAINRSRPGTQYGSQAKAWRNAQVDATARAISDELYPHPTLTQGCSRRLFLLSAGLDAEAARVRPCGPHSGCSDVPLPSGT